MHGMLELQRALRRERENAKYTTSLLAAARKTEEIRRKSTALALADAIAARKRFVTLSTDVNYNQFVADVTELANKENKVLDVKFHSYSGNMFDGRGKATLTLDVS